MYVCVCVIECVYVCYMVHIVELVCIDFFVLLTEDYSRNNAEEIGWPGAQLAFLTQQGALTTVPSSTLLLSLRLPTASP